MLRSFLLRPAVMGSALMVVITAALWGVFAPVPFGGRTTYVIVNGNSMEPGLHKGDLVLLRPAQQYTVGEIVMYRYPGLGPVIHRIVRQNGTRFVLKGDNNGWEDSYEPETSEIAGTFWLHIPRVGIAFGWLREPWAAAAVAGGTIFVLGVLMLKLPEPRGKRETPFWWKGWTRSASYWLARWQEPYFLVMYILAAAGIVLGLFAFTRPALRQVADNLPYHQTGYYVYYADLPINLYDNRRLESGDAIYPKLNCQVNVLFHYQLLSAAEFAGGGSYALQARVRDAAGWHRSFPLGEAVNFNGSDFQAQQVLDVCAAQRMIAEMEEVTGVQRPQYYLDITPNVQVAGTLGGRIIKTDFAPALSFVVEDQQVFLNTTAVPGADVLRPSAAGLLEGSRLEANTLDISRVRIPVNTARGLAVLLVVLSLVGLAVPVVMLQQAEKKEEKLRAHLVAGPKLVEAAGSLLAFGDRTVEVRQLEDLTRLAEKTGSMVFFHEDPPWATYLVRENGVSYYYRTLSAANRDSAPEVGNWGEDLVRALRNDELVLFYQPSVSMQDGQISQVEAFLRWQHPERGFLMPMQFLPWAEKSGLVQFIDEWVLNTGCLQLRRWQDQGYLNLPLAINISSYELRQEGLAKLVETVLKRHDLSAELLRVEIDESDLSLQPAILDNMRQLKALGVGISITAPRGESLEAVHSLLDVDQVKFGRNLVQQVLATESNSQSARQWIHQAHQRHIKVVAMGVETQEQYGFFQLSACDEAQGFFISPPMPADDLTLMLKKGSDLQENALGNDSGGAA